MKKNTSQFSLWDLFLRFFRVSSLTLGGGYSMLIGFEQFYVKDKKLLSSEEWDECVIIAQAAPGAFAVNLAYLVGFHIKRLRGALVATLGMVLPAFLAMILAGSFILYFISEWYVQSFLTGVACGPAAYYTIAFWKMAKTAFKKFWILVFFTLFTLMQIFLQIPLVFIILSAFVLIFIQIFWFLIRPHSLDPNSSKNDSEVY